MKASELKTGRTFAVTFDHGNDFMASPARFRGENSVRHGCMPMFLAGLAEAGIAGTCERHHRPQPG